MPHRPRSLPAVLSVQEVQRQTTTIYVRVAKLTDGEAFGSAAFGYHAKTLARRTNNHWPPIPTVEIQPMSAGATAGGAGAAAQQRQQCAEEEEMTPYTHKDLAEDWEFKILRSMSRAFRTPERLAAILEEEGKAGWMLVEKFDNRRIRLKRRAECRKDDRALGFDPYRSYVGSSEGSVVAVILAVAVAVGLAIFLLATVLA